MSIKAKADGTCQVRIYVSLDKDLQDVAIGISRVEPESPPRRRTYYEFFTPAAARKRAAAICRAADKQDGGGGLNLKPKWYIGNHKSGLLLGVAEWYAPWHRYCFSPATNTVFSDDCLQALADFCREATTDVKGPA